jgi:hypothetical protein
MRPGSVAAMFRDVIKEALCRTGLERICCMTSYTKYLVVFFLTVCDIYEEEHL